MIRSICVAGLVLAVAAMVGFALRSPAPSADSPLTASGSDVHQIVAATPEQRAAPTMDEAQLRRLIREELSAVSRDAVAEVPPAETSAPVPAEVLAQREQALREIDAALASGVWGDEQRRSLHQNLGYLSAGQAEEALRQVVMALNAGQLDVTTNGPPL